MSALHLDGPWMAFDLGAEMQVLSWSLTRPGFVRARQILWREVRNADLTPDLDVVTWFNAELAAHGAGDAVGLLTSRDIRAATQARVSIGAVTARAVATVGLSNAERVGARMDRAGKDWGTINIALRLDQPLSQAALLEAMSIAVQARTTAVIEAGYRLPTGLATGTGTDCVAVAAPEGEIPYAGLHTEIGEAVGRAVYDAVRQGVTEWMQSVRRPGEL